jgi:protocatechuate 3,4-dioxygenase beta subunit
MKNRVMIGLAATLMAAFLAQSAPRPQSPMTNGTLHGVVTDPSGAAIPGAAVIVSSGEFVQTVSTDETGQYTVPGLAPGHYRVHIHSAGFSIFGSTGLVLSAGYETEADAQLAISPARQVVTVTAEAE